MKITSQILSIPPYISTSWKNIASLHVETQGTNYVLIITLFNAARIEVPHLEVSMIEIIFNAHAKFLEQSEKPASPGVFPRLPLNFLMGAEQPLSLETPFKGESMEGLGMLLEHSREQAETPDLPPDVLEKIALLSKSMGIEDPNAVPKPEPGCNCMRCQIAKAMQAGVGDQKENKEEREEIVSDEELKFHNWNIVRVNDQLYTVTGVLDEKEQYSVFLGDPVGCTCGEKGCEHIHAVLNS